MVKEIFGTKVWGVEVLARSECRHWQGPTDIVALKFPCCGEFWACWDCHEAESGHSAAKWTRDDLDEIAILCGACGAQMTIRSYLDKGDRCDVCQHPFNPGCRKHRHLYYDFFSDGEDYTSQQL